MEINNIKLFAQNSAAINRSQSNTNDEDTEETTVTDNKPSEQQYSADDIFAFMAGSAIDFKAKVNGAETKEEQETRISGFMTEFEEAYSFAKDIGLSDGAIEKVFDKI